MRQAGHNDMARHDVRLQHVSGRRTVSSHGARRSKTANPSVAPPRQRGAVGRQQRKRSRVEGQLVRDGIELHRVRQGLRSAVRGHDKNDRDGRGQNEKFFSIESDQRFGIRTRKLRCEKSVQRFIRRWYILI